MGQTDRQKMAKREASNGLSPVKKKRPRHKNGCNYNSEFELKKIRQREATCLLHGVSLFNLPQVLLGIFNSFYKLQTVKSVMFYCNEEKHIGDVKSPKLLIS